MKGKKKGDERRIEREREGERDGRRKRGEEEEASQKKKPGAISPVSVSEEGEKRGGEQVCVHRKETTHTCTHTQRLGSQSERSRGAAELQAMQEHLVLPPLHPKHKNNAPKLSHTQKSPSAV